MKQVAKDIYYVGVNDHKTDLFEGMYVVPDGISYNSYVLKDKKIAVFDSVDFAFKTKWLNAVARVLDGALPDYLIITHMEPDHSANIAEFCRLYPKAKLVGNAKMFVMLEEYFGQNFSDRAIVVEDGAQLCTGRHTLNFVFAPMVHWPEVMTVYDEYSKCLFSADAFGKFGALDVSYDRWETEARRYYYGIVGKYGVQVKNYLNKIKNLPIDCILPLHGEILDGDIAKYVNFYRKWSHYESEYCGVMIAYTSVYGHTYNAVMRLREMLKDRGVMGVTVCDLARSDWSTCVAEAFMFDKIVFATTTYNGGIFPAMREFIDKLIERNFQSKRVGIIENGSWSPVAGKLIAEKFANSKDITFEGEVVKIRGSLNAKSLKQLEELAESLSK